MVKKFTGKKTKKLWKIEEKNRPKQYFVVKNNRFIPI